MWKYSELMSPVEVGSYFNANPRNIQFSINVPDANDLTPATICGIIIHITTYMEATHETTFYFLSADFGVQSFCNR